MHPVPPVETRAKIASAALDGMREVADENADREVDHSGWLQLA
jgi:hypothetical protein